MKPASFLIAQPTAVPNPAAPLPAALLATSSIATSAPQPHPQSCSQTPSDHADSREWIRHILFGNPETVRRTIHQLHQLRYTEATLWSPPMHPDNPLVMTPQPGEVMRLLRKQM